MITIKSGGSFAKTDAFLNAMKRGDAFRMLDMFGKEGVNALANATPVDTGLTANSWTYEVKHASGRYSIAWYNMNTESRTPVAILIQYGHGTGTGGYVQGRDYINPAIRPIFDRIAEQIWERVKNA